MVHDRLALVVLTTISAMIGYARYCQARVRGAGVLDLAIRSPDRRDVT
ncbi:hypothetical protein ACFWF7_40250 [Nocardia sp. NPDC060256]